MVDDAPGGADDDVGAVLQAGALRMQRCAAAKRQRLDVLDAAGQPADLAGDLVGEFASRAQHQGLQRERLDGKCRRAMALQTREQRERERGRLAAAGGGLHDQVLAVQRRRQARGLHRRHREVAELFEVGELRRPAARGG